MHEVNVLRGVVSSVGSSTSGFSGRRLPVWPPQTPRHQRRLAVHMPRAVAEATPDAAAIAKRGEGGGEKYARTLIGPAWIPNSHLIQAGGEAKQS
jgi:hypothetical protein